MNRLKNAARSFLQFGAILGLLEAPCAITKWQLQQYHQAEGAQTFFDACVDDYIAQGGTTDFVEQMLAIKDGQGNTVFENMPLCGYYLDGGTVPYAEALSQHVTKDGKPIFNFSNIFDFNHSHIPLSYIDGLLQLQDSKGNRVIDKRDINHYFEASISVDTLRDLFSIQEKNGMPLFTSGSALTYLTIGGSLSYAREAAAITDNNENQRLKDQDIIQFYNQNVSLDDVREGIQVVREDGTPFFSARVYSSFKEQGGTLEEALAFASLRYTNGQLVFESGNDIHTFSSMNGTVSYAQEASKITDNRGNPVFNREAIFALFDYSVSLTPSFKEMAKELHSLYDGNGASIFQGAWFVDYLTTNNDISYAQKLAAFRNPDDRSLFSGEDIALYFQAGGSVAYAQALTSVRDEKGYALFDGNSIRKAWDWKLDPAYAREVAALKNEHFPLDGFRIIRYWQLEVTKEDLQTFEDTERPNALVIYPTADHEDSPVFELDNQLQIFYGFRKHYDVLVRIAAQEQEVYDALLAMPAVDLFYLGGHGIPTTLSLGEKDLALEERTKDETYTIDVGDTELSYYLSTLESKAVIVQSSCENAKPLKEQQNLAQFMEEMSTEYDTQRTITAARGKIIANLDEVISWVPFSMLHYEENSDEITEMTYSSN